MKPFGLCFDQNSNFKYFCREPYCLYWNAVGSLMEKTSKFAQAGKTVKYLSRMVQGGMGVVAGISMAKTGFTNILNGLESGNLSGWDVVTFKEILGL